MPRDSAPPPIQPVLPLDLDPDEPVPYRLTARARRLVDPDSLPSLSVVASDPTARSARGAATRSSELQDAWQDLPTDLPHDLDDPHDPRSARARAMRRGGLSVAQIAAQLGVDELVVRTWTEAVGPAPRRRRTRLSAVPEPRHATPAAGAAPTVGAPVPDDAADAEAQRLQRRRQALHQARIDASADAAARLADPAFVRGLALTVAAAEIDLHAVLVTLRDRDVARTVRMWLVDQAGADVRDIRVVLRLPTTAQSDLTLHRWAEALDLPLDQLARTKWQAAPSQDAVQALVRVSDAEVAARLAGWRDALLGSASLPDMPEGVGF